MAPPLLALRGASVRIASQVLFEGLDVAVAKGLPVLSVVSTAARPART